MYFDSDSARIGRWNLNGRSFVTIGLSIAYVVVGVICLVLVLLHSGRGGGLSDMFGGGLGATAAGSTSVERNLDRMTIFFSLLFAMLTIVLVFQLG